MPISATVVRRRLSPASAANEGTNWALAGRWIITSEPRELVFAQSGRAHLMFIVLQSHRGEGFRKVAAFKQASNYIKTGSAGRDPRAKADYRQHCRGDNCPNFAPANLIQVCLPLSNRPGNHEACAEPPGNQKVFIPPPIEEEMNGHAEPALAVASTEPEPLVTASCPPATESSSASSDSIFSAPGL